MPDSEYPSCKHLLHNCPSNPSSAMELTAGAVPPTAGIHHHMDTELGTKWDLLDCVRHSHSKIFMPLCFTCRSNISSNMAMETHWLCFVSSCHWRRMTLGKQPNGNMRLFWFLCCLLLMIALFSKCICLHTRSLVSASSLPLIWRNCTRSGDS